MIILYLLIALPILGILVFVHEFGHFIMAKWNKIGVDAFSIGFGKEIFGFTIGETRYKISLIPFGGYCKMRGEEHKDREAQTENDPRAMYNRPPLARLFAIIGGALFNYLFAILIMSLLIWHGFSETLISPQVAIIEKDGKGEFTPAYKAGLRSEDTIISIGGEKIESYMDIPKIVVLNVDKPLSIEFIRKGITNNAIITPRYSDSKGAGYIGVTPLFYTTIGYVTSNSPASMAGLKPGDKILKIDNTTMTYFYEIDRYIEDKTNREVSVTLLRIETNGASNVITQKIKVDRFESRGYIGIAPLNDYPTFEKIHKANNLLTAFKEGFIHTHYFLFETLRGFKAMFSGKIDIRRNVAGPVRILQMTGEIATKTDITTLLRFMALLSVALGFFNMLPIPGFDGGHALFNLAELISRKKLSEKARAIIEMTGFIFIITLSIFVFLNDILNLLYGR